MRVAVAGASSGIGAAFAREWARLVADAAERQDLSWVFSCLAAIA